MECDSPNTDILARMRRLSVGSSGSSYSLVSAVSTVKSLDSNGSYAGGVKVADSVSTPVKPGSAQCSLPTPKKSRRKKSNAATTQQVPLPQQQQQPPPSSPPQKQQRSAKRKPKQSSPSSSAPQAPAKPMGPSTKVRQLQPVPISPPRPGSSYWFSFLDFEPDTGASFNREFSRLAKHECWGKKTRYKQKIEALAAEMNFHYGMCPDELARWQQLCRDVGIEEVRVPRSIKGCRKELKPVLVNIYNLIDHKRNENIPLMRFKSYGEFSRYTKDGHQFPKEFAKKDGFVRVLLKKV